MKVAVLVLFGIFSVVYSTDDICLQLGNDALVANKADCSTYYECTHGSLVLMRCNEGLLFNDAEKYCDYPENVACSQVNEEETIPSPRKDDKVVLQELCGAYGDASLLPSLDNCAQFYECSGGKPFLFDCPANLYFNDLDQRCDYQENVVCATSYSNIKPKQIHV